MNLDDLTLSISQEIEIKAAPGSVYRNMIAQLSHIMGGDGKAMDFTLEEWPGGRWFRDLGNGQGHLWGFVQVIKPPTLLEITGPLFMSYACSNHVQYRLAADGIGTKLVFTHRAIGEIAEDHRKGVNEGWNHFMDRIRSNAEAKQKSR